MLLFSFSFTGNCPPGTKTTDTDGRCCAFPFICRGRTDRPDTTAAPLLGMIDFGVHSTLAEYRGQWADCGE